MKFSPVRAELFNADGRTDGRRGTRTDITKLIVAFRNFANAPKLQKWDIVYRNKTFRPKFHRNFSIGPKSLVRWQ